MTNAYSVLLGLAISAAVLSWFLLATSRRWPASRNLSTATAYGALVLDAVSLVIHLFVGHQPGSPDGMAFGQFFAQHPAFLVVLLAAAAVVALGKKTTLAASPNSHS